MNGIFLCGTLAILFASIVCAQKAEAEAAAWEKAMERSPLRKHIAYIAFAGPWSLNASFTVINQCVGTVLSRKWLLTSADCRTPSLGSDFYLKRTKAYVVPEDGGSLISRGVAEVFLLEKLMLVRLTKPFPRAAVSNTRLGSRVWHEPRIGRQIYVGAFAEDGQFNNTWDKFENLIEIATAPMVASNVRVCKSFSGESLPNCLIKKRDLNPPEMIPRYTCIQTTGSPMLMTDERGNIVQFGLHFSQFEGYCLDSSAYFQYEPVRMARRILLNAVFRGKTSKLTRVTPL